MFSRTYGKPNALKGGRNSTILQSLHCIDLPSAQINWPSRATVLPKRISHNELHKLISQARADQLKNT